MDHSQEIDTNKVLMQFYCDWLTWAKKGPVSRFFSRNRYDFRKNEGLCFSLTRWCFKKKFAKFELNKIHACMLDQFGSSGLSEVYPFGIISGRKDETKNEKRLEWVSDKTTTA